MAKIGVFGAVGSKTRERALNLFNILLKNRENEHTIRAFPSESAYGVFDVIMCAEDAQDAEHDEAEAWRGVDGRTLFVVNPACANLLARLPQNGGPLITCGFNGKVCVTVSGVAEDGLQICVQRNIPTVSGRLVEPGEFFAQVPAGILAGAEDEELALAVITALTAADHLF